MAFTPQQTTELQTAYDRIQAGNAGAASATNAGDVANVNYAMQHGWQPNVGSVTDASSLSNVPTVTGAPSSLDTSSSALAGFTAAQNTYNALATTAEKNAGIPDLQNQQGKLLTDIAGVTKTLGSKASALSAAESSLGIPEQTKQLQELNTQISSKTAEYEKAIEALSAGTGLSTTIAGKQGQLRRQQAVEVGALTSLAQAVQGNISLAKDTAKRTVDLQFEDAQNQLDALKAQLDQNRDSMTAAEKKKADEISATLALQQKALDAEKDNKTKVYDVMLTAAKNGADNVTLSAIKNSATPETAIAAAGKFLQSASSTNPITKTVGKTLYQWDPASATWKVASGVTPAPTTTKKSTSTSTTKNALQTLYTQLPQTNILGGDGYMSPQDYLALRNAWIQDGYNPADFDKGMAAYRNPKNTEYVTNK